MIIVEDRFSSEKLIRTQAQLMVDGGYLAAGYEYIIIDDCWLNGTRAAVCTNFICSRTTNVSFLPIIFNRMDRSNPIINVFPVEFGHYPIMFIP